MRAAHGRNFFRRAAGDDSTTMRAAFGPQVNNEIGALYDVEVVLDDDDCVAKTHQTLKHVKQLVDVGEVEPGGWLIENVNRSSGRSLGKFFGQLNSLGLAAGKRRR